MFRRDGWIWLGAMFLLIAGCAATIPSVETFNNAPRDVALVPGEGGLIVGLEPVSLITLGRQVSRLELWQVDVDRGLLLDPKKGAKVVGLTHTLFERNVDGDMEYLLQRLPAGRYFLTYVNWGDHGHNPIHSRSIAFTVKPGETTYIGDFGFDTPWTVLSDVEMRILPRRPEAARKLLAQYKKLGPTFWDQEPVLLSLKCDLSAKGAQACLAG
jgi:hypothetical protein